MTAATLSHLPLAAGGAMLSSAGRMALWAFARYMRAPLTHTGLLLLVGSSALAASNALYLQQQMHPAPLFAPPAPAVTPTTPPVAPVTPAIRQQRPQVVTPLAPAETTGSIAPEPEAAIGNAEVFELQRKLTMMKLFEGKVDGYYGPQTAGAIRRFEERMGLTPTGELTGDIIEAVRAASPFAAPPREDAGRPAAAPADTAPSTPAAQLPTVAPAAEQSFAPLPAPAPLQATLQAPVSTATTSEAAPVRHRELPETPQEAFNIAVDTAGDAIDTIIEGVQTVTMNRPGTRPTPRQDLSQPSARALPALPRTGGSAARTETQVAMVDVAPPTPTAAPAVVDDVSAAAPAELPPLDTDARPEDLMPPFSVTDPATVASVQRGLASLGFLHGPADGVAGAATAKAIRNFEVYFNYKVTGRITPELLDLLVRNGASI